MKSKKAYTNGEKIAYFKRRIAELETKNANDYESQDFSGNLQRQLDELRGVTTDLVKTMHALVDKVNGDNN